MPDENTNPLVSIVVPAYNAAPFVAETLNSLLLQTYKNLEIIVINDGSTDNTAKIIEPFANRLQVENQENLGQAQTLNRGWQMSRGSIFAYLSADDIYYPQAVEAAVQMLTQSPKLGVVYPDYDLIDVQSKLIKRVEAPEYDFAAMFLRSVCAPGPGAFFRAELFRMTGGWDPTLRQMPDFDFWLRCAGSRGSAGFSRIPKVLAGFRVHEESQTFRVPTPSKSEEPVLVMEKFLTTQIENKSVYQKANQARAFSHILAARLHARGSRTVDMFKHIQMAARHSPGILLSPFAMRLLVAGWVGPWWYRLRAKTKVR